MIPIFFLVPQSFTLEPSPVYRTTVITVITVIHFPLDFLIDSFVVLCELLVLDLECTMFSQINLHFLILFDNEVYGLNKQIYILCCHHWLGFFGAQPLVCL